MFARAFRTRDGPHPQLEALLHKLLAAGADPLLPPHTPSISLIGYDLAGPLAECMVQAHRAGQRPLSPAHAVALLQLVLRHGCRAAYPLLLAVLRQEGAQPLPASLALQLVAAAAHWGNEAAVQDALALVPPGALAGPEAAPACLLAHATLDDRPARLWDVSDELGTGRERSRILQLLLDAKVALHVNDVCRVVQDAQPSVVRRLLRIGQPRVSGAGGGGGWVQCGCHKAAAPVWLCEATTDCLRSRASLACPSLQLPASPLLPRSQRPAHPRKARIPSSLSSPPSTCHCLAARPHKAVCRDPGQHRPTSPSHGCAGVPRAAEPVDGGQQPPGAAGVSRQLLTLLGSGLLPAGGARKVVCMASGMWQPGAAGVLEQPGKSGCGLAASKLLLCRPPRATVSWCNAAPDWFALLPLQPS